MNKREIKTKAKAVTILIIGVLTILYLADVYHISQGFEKESNLRSDMAWLGFNTHELEMTAKYQDNTGLVVVYWSDKGYRVKKFYKKAVLSSNLYLEKYEVDSIGESLVEI